MSDIYDAAASVARDAVGKVLCAAGGLSRLGQDIAGKVNPFYEGSLLDGYQTGVTNALNRFCPVPPQGAPVAPETPFSGGQCADVSYAVVLRLTYDWTPNPGGFVAGAQVFTAFQDLGRAVIFGPINGFTVSPEDEGFKLSMQVRANSRDGTPLIGSPIGSGGGDIPPAGNQAVRNLRVSNISITRNDGLPDNCGDPPPVFPPGTPNPTDPRPPDTTINIDLPDIGPVDITFSPTVGIVYVNNQGDFIVPVTVSVFDTTNNIDLDIDIGINISDPTAPPEPIDPSPPKNPDDRPEEPDCPPVERCDDGPEEEPPEEEPPIEERAYVNIAGVAVLAAVNPLVVAATEVLQLNGPNIWVPRLGYIRFGYEMPEGDIVYSEDIPVKLTNQLIEPPQKSLRCVEILGNPENGVTWELVQITEKITSKSCR